MQINDVGVAVALFLGTIVPLIFFRIRSGGRITVQSNEAAIALIPVMLWLFVSGKIEEFGFGDVKVKAAVNNASTAQVKSAVTELPVDDVTQEEKEGLSRIPHMISAKIGALSFQLGTGRYVGHVIGEYLRQLTAYPHLRHLIFNSRDGRFAGMADPRGTLLAMYGSTARFSPDQLARWINEANMQELGRLPGYLSAESAIHRGDRKEDVLKKMAKLDSEILPVIDDANRFAGVVSRSKLTASILLDINNQLQGSTST